jgi:hypothetical protein
MFVRTEEEILIGKLKKKQQRHEKGNKKGKKGKAIDDDDDRKRNSLPVRWRCLSRDDMMMTCVSGRLVRRDRRARTRADTST